MYIDVPGKNRCCENRSRFNPNRPDSILEHGLSDEKMEKLYRETDWNDLMQSNSETLTLQGINVPFAIFENADDVTTAQGQALGERLESTLSELWQRYQPFQS